jgi:hypothetical protein
VRPRAQCGRLGDQISDRIVSIVTALPELLPIGKICALAEPIVRYRPAPSELPIGEPIIPRGVIDSARNSVDKSRNRGAECRLYAPTKFLITPSMFDLSYLLVG